MTVATNATLGVIGTLGGSTTIAAGGRLEFNLSTPAGSHNPLDLVTGKGLTFSGASTLTITSSGGASPKIYTLVTGGNSIGGAAPATLNLPVGWAATVSISGNSLLLIITSTGGPGPVDHFVISSIASPQTVGTAITGITITAQDAANATAASFTGTVTFGGTAGITGTSNSFITGVLTGVIGNPTVSGNNLTFTVSDVVSGKIGSSTINTIRTAYQAWAGSDVFTADANSDGISNGLAWLLGASGPINTITLPVTSRTSTNLVLEFTCLKLAKRGGSKLMLQYSNDLGVTDPWTSREVAVPDEAGPVGVVTFSIPSANPNPNLVNLRASIPARPSSLFSRLQGQEN